MEVAIPDTDRQNVNIVPVFDLEDLVSHSNEQRSELVECSESCDDTEHHLVDKEIHVDVAKFRIHHAGPPVSPRNKQADQACGEEVVQSVPECRECLALDPDYIVDDHEQHDDC